MCQHLPERIVAMHKEHGRAAGQRCGRCQHLVVCASNRTRCAKAPVRCDWSSLWPACGQFAEYEAPWAGRKEGRGEP